MYFALYVSLLGLHYGKEEHVEAWVARLEIFAKGNLDVRDTLLFQRLGDKLVWNGVNDILAGLHSCKARVKHETWTRSDALLESSGAVPEELAESGMPLGPYPLPAQFGSSLFNSDADAFVLSIQPEICNRLVRHRRDGYLFFPYNRQAWQADQLAWVKSSFVDARFLEPEESMANLQKVIERIRVRSSSPILVYNVSSFVPGERVHCHTGVDDLFSTRVKRFNIALVELSRQTGISVIDVDRLLAELGCARMMYDSLHFNADGCRAVAGEVVRVLGELGCLPGGTA